MREKFEEYCEVISGYAFKSNDLLAEGDIPVIKIGNISNGGDVIVDEGTQYVLDEFLSINKKYHIKKGDLLISLTGSHINQPNSMVGRTCRNYSDNEYLLNQRAGKIIPSDKANADYLYYLFSSKAIKESIVIRAYGAANQVNVSPTAIVNMKWDFPDIITQRKVGGFLKLFDDMIQNNNKRIKLLEQMAENLYKEWFVRFRFPEYNTTEFEGGIPKGWEIVRIKNLVDRLPYGKLYKANDVLPEGDVIVIDQSTNAWLGFHNDLPSHMASIDNPIALFGDHSCKYQLMITPFSLSENVIPYKAKGDNDISYLYYVFYGIVETTEYKRHWTEFSAKKVLIAPSDLQKKFVELVKPIILLKEKYIVENRNLVKQRNLLLPRLMSGKLEVK